MVGTIGKTATKVLQHQDFCMVVYHNTVVAKWDTDKIILDNGGYMTATTKRRMNQAAETFDLNFKVFQKAGEWFVKYLRSSTAHYSEFKTIPFTSGMQINRIQEYKEQIT